MTGMGPQPGIPSPNNFQFYQTQPMTGVRTQRAIMSSISLRLES